MLTSDNDIRRNRRICSVDGGIESSEKCFVLWLLEEVKDEYATSQAEWAIQRILL